MSAVADRSDVQRKPAIDVEGLRVDLRDRDINVVDDISFSLRAGEILGLIGESGCGKTTVAAALLGHGRPGTVISGGSITVDGVNLFDLQPSALRRYRGAVVAYVPQDPGLSLNPAMRIGAQLEETLSQHGVSERGARHDRITQMLSEVKLPSDKSFLHRYPHELSGGQQQRVAIAIAFLCQPRVVVLDEPTTGLDVTTQAHVLRMVRTLCGTHQTAGVYVSHDLAVVADLADRIAVMYFGRMIEVGPARDVIQGAAHPYSRGLVEVIPDARRRRAIRSIRGRVAPLQDRPHGCVFADRCDFCEPECRAAPIAPVALSPDHLVRCRRTEVVRATSVGGPSLEPAAEASSAPAPGKGYLSIRGVAAAYYGNQVLHGVDLDIPRGVVMALVGESGSGKTTLARCIGGLHYEASGEIALAGKELSFGARRRSPEERKRVQYIFQNASEAMNPRKTVGQAIAQPLRTLEGRHSSSELRQRVEELMELVSLAPRLADRYPSQLSGGERQRVTIARALATDPSVLICDEITSALDVSVQAAILMLIRRLCAESELTLLFVTHNLAVVRAIADRVAVLNAGEIVEQGPVSEVLDSPADAYTQQLLHDTPTLVEV